MSGTIQRRTLYALLSELETDLRQILRNELLPVLGVKLLSDDEKTRAYARFAKEQGAASSGVALDDLLDYLDLADAGMIINRHNSCLPRSSRRIMSKLCSDLPRLIPIRNRVMHSRPLEFDDFTLSLIRYPFSSRPMDTRTPASS